MLSRIRQSSTLQIVRYSTRKEAFILSAVRTPIGSFNGALSSLSTSRLGGTIVKASLSRAGVDAKSVQSVYLGNVVSGGYRDNLVRQAATLGGIPTSVSRGDNDSLCVSGAVAVDFGAADVEYGTLTNDDFCVVGGFESISKSSAYLQRTHPVGDVDTPCKDGFWDFHNNFDLGQHIEDYAKSRNITREMQDNFTIISHKRAAAAHAEGKFKDEIVPVTFRNQEGMEAVFSEDEHINKFDPDKIRAAKPFFHANGRITSANSCKLSDGAAALVLASGDVVKQHKLKAIGRIIAHARIMKGPHHVLAAPVMAINKVFEKSFIHREHIDYYEIPDTFSALSIDVMRELKLDPSVVNLHGGTLSLGHPMGASGARIIISLLNVLRKNKGRYGLACISNMSGEAVAIIVHSFG